VSIQRCKGFARLLDRGWCENLFSVTNSLRKSMLRGLGFAVASGALIGAPAMAAPEAPVAAPISVALAFLLCHGDQCPSKDVSTAAAN